MRRKAKFLLDQMVWVYYGYHWYKSNILAVIFTKQGIYYELEIAPEYVARFDEKYLQAVAR